MAGAKRYRKHARADSSPSSPARSETEDEPASSSSESEKDKFDKHFETTTKSNEEVLGLSFKSVFFATCCTDYHLLVAQMKPWKSAVYDHFKSPPAILVEREIVKYKFICKTNPYVSG